MNKNWDLDGAHWAFSLLVYAEPGISENCLFLQDNYELDVNVLLIGLYAVTCLNLSCSEEEITLMDKTVKPLRDTVIKPLRKIRRDMKGLTLGLHGESIRTLVKRNELQTEQLEQAILVDLLDRGNINGPHNDPVKMTEDIIGYFANTSGVSHKFATNKPSLRPIFHLIANAAIKAASAYPFQEHSLNL